MPLSKDPARRKKQLGNLRPAGATSHGATSERRLAPLRAKHRAELLERYPKIDPERLSLLCDLLSRIDLARDFVDVHGLMKNTRQTHPVLELLGRWEKRAWDCIREIAPVRTPVGPDLPVIDLTDREVQRTSREFLRAVGAARARKVAEAKEKKR